jgi:hypothetical protein
MMIHIILVKLYVPSVLVVYEVKPLLLLLLRIEFIHPRIVLVEIWENIHIGDRSFLANDDQNEVESKHHHHQQYI